MSWTDILGTLFLKQATVKNVEAAADKGYDPFPKRDPWMPGGKEFIKSLANGVDRDKAIKGQILAGNVPDFMRSFVPVTSIAMVGQKQCSLTMFVSPDYLCIGSNEDWVSVPMNWECMREVCINLKCYCPTKRIVDLCYHAAPQKMAPQPMPPTSEMVSNGYLLAQNDLIQAMKSARGFKDGILIAGHKKDVVSSPKQWSHPGMEAIYGWHQSNGKPIQPLSFAHQASYSDYSHGGRLIASECVLDGVKAKMEDIIASDTLHVLVSDEGPF